MQMENILRGHSLRTTPISGLNPVTPAKFIQAEGPLQNQDGVIHVKAMSLRPLSDQALEVHSHGFH
jgi:hypothetical protein